MQDYPYKKYLDPSSLFQQIPSIVFLLKFYYNMPFYF